uniref:EF-hand domain-containing protein n=1 Tax=Tetraselmis sp. GSL018 TaxID=582737 RepID=A0A061SF46_9CHLO|mmetsp:Transcript_21199/g.50601  ORF Transcript_21199/g.50601 Transcript_21199/m.50601 type:complete len:490 (-) Transcript_21199:289-1758(-)
MEAYRRGRMPTRDEQSWNSVAYEDQLNGKFVDNRASQAFLPHLPRIGQDQTASAVSYPPSKVCSRNVNASASQRLLRPCACPNAAAGKAQSTRDLRVYPPEPFDESRPSPKAGTRQRYRGSDPGVTTKRDKLDTGRDFNLSCFGAGGCVSPVDKTGFTRFKLRNDPGPSKLPSPSTVPSLQKQTDKVARSCELTSGRQNPPICRGRIEMSNRNLQVKPTGQPGFPVDVGDTDSGSGEPTQQGEGTALEAGETRSPQRSPSMEVKGLIDSLFRVKRSHYVGNNHTNFSLNKAAGGESFVSGWVRPSLLKQYYSVFTDMNVDNKGRVSLGDFQRYLKEKNPELLPHAQSLFGRVTTDAPRQRTKLFDDSPEPTVSFRDILKVIFPQASDDDILKLQQMAKPCGLPPKRVLMQQFEDARHLFHKLNVSGNGKLTEQEVEEGLIRLGQDLEEVSSMLIDLFGDEDDEGDLLPFVDFHRFFEWYSGFSLQHCGQ